MKHTMEMDGNTNSERSSIGCDKRSTYGLGLYSVSGVLEPARSSV